MIRKLFQCFIGFYFLLFLGISCKAKKELSKIESSETYYLSKGIADKELIIFLIGFNQKIESAVDVNKEMIEVLNKNSYSVLFLNTTSNLIYDDLEIKKLYDSSMELLNKLNFKRISVGGFSMGGLGAAKFALKLKEANYICNNLILVDCPLDLNRFKQSLLHQINSKETVASNEAKSIIELLKSKADASGVDLDSLCKKESIFLYSDSSLGKITNYSKMNIMVFSNSAIDWQFINRNRSVYDMHVVDLSHFLTTLKKLGNNNIHLWIKNTQKENPHSWSNINQDSLLNWLNNVWEL